MLDRTERAGAGAPAMSGDVDVIGARFGHARGDRADAARGDQLDPDPGRRVDRPQVGDQLRQVLDRVDVVMGRRADQRLARARAPEGGDVLRGLAAGQLPAFARFRALGDLDLELLGSGQVGCGHPKARRGDLLDAGVAPLAVDARLVPGGILAALTRIGGAAGSLDPDRHRLMRLGREGADAHG